MNIDRIILAELKRFFRETKQTNWGKNQIRDKIDEIAEEAIDTWKEMMREQEDGD